MNSHILTRGLSLALILSAAGCMGFTKASKNPNVSGNWQVQFNITPAADGGATATPITASPLCTFRQTGDQVTGTCKGPQDQGAVTGTVDDQYLAFTWQTARGTWTFNGMVLSNRITGSGTAPGVVGTGLFTAQKR